MADLLPWEKVSGAPEFQSGDPDFQDKVRRQWLERAIQSNPSLDDTQKTRLILRVYDQPDPLSSVQPVNAAREVGGFIGQGAAKVGRVAAQAIDLPFKPLHAFKERILVPIAESAPEFKKPFEYQTPTSVEAAQMTQEDPTGVFGVVGGGVPRSDWLGETHQAPFTRGRAIAEAAEMAMTGSYVKSILGTLASRGIAPAVRYVDQALRDNHILEQWTKGKRLFELSGRILNIREGVAELMGTSVYNKWNRLAPEAAKRKEVRDLIEGGITDLMKSDPAQAAAKIQALDPGQQAALSWYLGRDAARAKIGVDFGILRTPKDDYVAHVMQELEIGKTGVLFQLHRKGKLTLQELEAMKASPFIDDIAIVDAIHETAFQRLLAKKMFGRLMMGLKGENGLPAVISEQRYQKMLLADPTVAESYTQANETKTRIQKFLGIFGARKVETVGPSTEELEKALAFYEQKLFVHNDFRKQVNRFLPPLPQETDLEKFARTVIHGSRRLIMANPLVHGVNITSTVVAASPFGDVPQMYRFFSEGGRVLKGALAGEEPALSLLMESVHDGARIPAISSTYHRLAQDMLRGKLPGGNFFTRMTDASDRFLFDNIVSSPMYGMYKHVRDKWEPLLGRGEAGRLAAEYVNLNQGTIPIESFAPFMQRWGQYILFSRSWTLSNFRSLSQAMGIPWGARHLKPETQIALSREWAETWSRSLAYLGIQNEVMNRAIAGHSSADNPPGHELDVDTGRYDKQGRRIYVAGSPFLFVRQMARRAGHLVKGDIRGLASDFYGVLGVYKGIGEALWNYDVFTGQHIVMPGAPTGEQLGRGALHAVSAMTPFGSQMREASKPGAEVVETVREVLDSPEDWARFFTYWPSHGLTYHTEVFTRLKKADQFLILNNMSPEARQGLIKGITFGRIEGAASVELKDLKDRITYLREHARSEALHQLMRGETVPAAKTLVKAGWSVDGARTFIATRGRKMGRLQGEKEEE